MLRTRTRSVTALLTGLGVTLALTGCSGSGGAAPDTITWSVENTDQTIAVADALAAAFEKENAGTTVEVESRPASDSNDTVVKTRLNSGDLGDVVTYQSGSNLSALNPAANFVDLSDEPWVGDLNTSFPEAVTIDGALYGAPLLGAAGGGIIYNKKIYEQLGLSVPKTWDDFIANSEQIKTAGIAPIIQTYKDPWTSQFMVLNDYFNVQAAVPTFAEDWTAGEVKYADTPAALAGFEHLKEIQDKGLVNADYASATYDNGLEMLATGTGAQYPNTSGVIAGINTKYPEASEDLGFFAIPGEDASSNGATIFQPQAVYVTKASENVDLAKKFVSFIASAAGCDAAYEAIGVSGVSPLSTCELPSDVPSIVRDVLPYTQSADTSASALEFVSRVKGPGLPDITVAVGSGLTSPADGAKQYDDDSAKQAQQLGLPGW